MPLFDSLALDAMTAPWPGTAPPRIAMVGPVLAALCACLAAPPSIAAGIDVPPPAPVAAGEVANQGEPRPPNLSRQVVEIVSATAEPLHLRPGLLAGLVNVYGDDRGVLADKIRRTYSLLKTGFFPEVSARPGGRLAVREIRASIAVVGGPDDVYSPPVRAHLLAGRLAPDRIADVRQRLGEVARARCERAELRASVDLSEVAVVVVPNPRPGCTGSTAVAFTSVPSASPGVPAASPGGGSPTLLALEPEDEMPVRIREPVDSTPPLEKHAEVPSLREGRRPAGVALSLGHHPAVIRSPLARIPAIDAREDSPRRPAIGATARIAF